MRLSQARDANADIHQLMELASEFAGKITSALSIPDVINAYQNWISKRMALYVEDGQKLFEASQKILNTTTKPLF